MGRNHEPGRTALSPARGHTSRTLGDPCRYLRAPRLSGQRLGRRARHRRLYRGRDPARQWHGPGAGRAADRRRSRGLQLADHRPTGPHEGRALLRKLCRHGPGDRTVVDRAAGRPAEPQHPRQELRDQPSQGQRRGRKSGGDRGDRRVAGRRHRAGGVRGRRLLQLRRGTGRIGVAPRRHHPSL
jgi:hypothetical protein